MPYLLILFLLISCGKNEDAKRCYTREEAILNCAVKEIAHSGVDVPTAKMLCAPKFSYDGCYDL